MLRVGVPPGGVAMKMRQAGFDEATITALVEPARAELRRKAPKPPSPVSQPAKPVSPAKPKASKPAVAGEGEGPALKDDPRFTKVCAKHLRFVLCVTRHRSVIAAQRTVAVSSCTPNRPRAGIVVAYDSTSRCSRWVFRRAGSSKRCARRGWIRRSWTWIQASPSRPPPPLLRPPLDHR